MESKVYQEFKQRQAEIDHLYWLTSRQIQEDIHLLSEPEDRRNVLEEMTSLIVPKGSYMDRFLSLFKVPSISSQRRTRRSTQYIEKIAYFFPPKIKSIINSALKYQPILQIVYTLTKPLLITAGISTGRSILRTILRRIFR